ncbi:hypothetical protein HPP92_028747 [Vanilla planifolia]|uniref:Uncharacterized protein n=1 Tax=Vanilla planifolia TaxID=51239 RepID=A0A835P4P3_VANPL|nr:hypothetical protein HPP92_028747 [Vanilla planifolia]KAG0446658.1 hypothetical protein HPP92_028736 [Vanilla planifolia]
MFQFTLHPRLAFSPPSPRQLGNGISAVHVSPPGSEPGVPRLSPFSFKTIPASLSEDAPSFGCSSSNSNKPPCFPRSLNSSKELLRLRAHRRVPRMAYFFGYTACSSFRHPLRCLVTETTPEHTASAAAATLRPGTAASVSPVRRNRQQPRTSRPGSCRERPRVVKPRSSGRLVDGDLRYRELRSALLVADAGCAPAARGRPGLPPRAAIGIGHSAHWRSPGRHLTGGVTTPEASLPQRRVRNFLSNYGFTGTTQSSVETNQADFYDQGQSRRIISAGWGRGDRIIHKKYWSLSSLSVQVVWRNLVEQEISF